MSVIGQMLHQLRPTRRRTALVRHSRRQPRSLALVPLLQHRPRQLIAIPKMPVKTSLAHMQIPRQHLNAHRINPIQRQPRKRGAYPITALQRRSLRCPYRCR